MSAANSFILSEAKEPLVFAEARPAQFAEVFQRVPPARAVAFIRSLPVVERARFDEFVRRSGGPAFTAANVESEAALRALRNLVAESLEAGLSQRQFEQLARELLREFQAGPTRLRTLWNTTVANAQQAGRNAAFEDPDTAAFLRFGLFDAMNDFFTRPNHRALDNALAPREWWQANRELQPLLGWNCRCVLLWMSSARARREEAARTAWRIDFAGVPAEAGPDEGFAKAFVESHEGTLRLRSGQAPAQRKFGGRELPELRVPRTARREARETNFDVETLLAAATLEQWRFFGQLTPALLEAAVGAFRSGVSIFHFPVSPSSMTEHAARLALIIAAAQALGELRVRLEGGLLVLPRRIRLGRKNIRKEAA